MIVKNSSTSDPLRAGVAKDVITPPIGIPLAGYAFEKKASIGIHDELYARAVVLEQGTTRAALVICDVLGFERPTVQKIRTMVEQTTGIPQQNVVVAATHTHSGPVGLFEGKEYRGVLSVGGLFQHDNASYTGDKFDQSLVDILIRKIAGTITSAAQHMQEVRVGTLSGTVEDIGKNRIDPAYANDPEVAVTVLAGADGPVGILYGYACHPTVLHQDNRLISADFPGHSNLQLEKLSKALPIFMTGAAGDISTRYTRRETTFREAARLGSILASETFKVVNRIVPHEVSCLSVQSKIVALPVRELPSSEEAHNRLRRAQARLKELRTQHASAAELKSAETHVEGAQATINLLEKSRIAELEHIDIEMQLLQIGDTGILTIPGELFVQPGKDIKAYARSKGFSLHICCYANGKIGYIPTEEVFKEGGYEAGVAVVGARTVSMIVKTAQDLLGNLMASSSVGN